MDGILKSNAGGSIWYGQVKATQEGDKGDRLAREGKWKEALGHYDRAIGLDPRDSWNYFRRGWAHFQLKDWDKSLSEMSQPDCKGLWVAEIFLAL